MTALGVETVVPLVDLHPVNDEVRPQVGEAWERIVSASNFVLGEEVESFEHELAAYYGTAHCVTVANGTDALEIALRSLGIGPGDEVIVPAMTFAATGIAVLRAGATPVFADVSSDTLLVDPTSVKAQVTSRTAAVIPVHLHGQMAPVEELAEICGSYGLAMIEDAAQSQGATRRGRRCGPSAFVCTSFYPTKNLGAWGDGGAVLTRDETLASAARRLRNYGSRSKYDHESFGFNSRLDSLQAAVLRAKLPRLDAWNHRRRLSAALYRSLLEGTPGLTLPVPDALNEHVWHVFAVRLEDRNNAAARLESSGVATGVHYPTPLHLLPVFGGPAGRGRFPAAEAAADTLLSLPMFAGIRPDQQEKVAEAI